MKKCIILVLSILLIFNYYNLFSQVKIDPPKLSQFYDTTIVQREPDRFVRGWTCASHGNMLDSAMFINTYYGYPYDWMEGSNESVHNVLVIDRPGHWDSGLVEGRSNNVIFNTQSLYLEPSLDLDTTQNFTPRANDYSGAAMGFLYRNNVVSHDSIDINGNGYLVLQKNNLPTDSVVVLSNIWKNDCLRWYNAKETNHVNENSTEDINNYHPFNGKQFFISVNLRALNLDSIQNHLNDVILKIRLPYTLKTVTPLTFTNGLTKFNYLPTGSVDSIFGSRGDYRGCARDTAIDYNKSTDFVIMGWMLQSSDTTTNQITISALASFDGDTIPFIGGYRNNPRFQPENSDTNVKQYITKIDVEVYYFGKIDLILDWIKLETPKAKQIFNGFFDNRVSGALDTTIYDLQSNNKHPRLFRFYGNDELNPQEWGVTRYLNMLLDTLVTLETFITNGNDAPHYLHATGMKHFWNGSNIDFYTFIAAPYIKKTNRFNPSTLNYSFGFAGNPDVTFDTLNSDYETKIFCSWNDKNDSIHDNKIPVKDLDLFEYKYISDTSLYYYEVSTQFQIEKRLYYNYHKNSTLIFSSKPWWANLWVQSDAIKYRDSNINAFTLEAGKARPKTGEEVRLMATLPVLLGAKGLMYWFKSSSGDFQQTNSGGWIGLQPFANDYSSIYGNLSGEELLKSNALGGDYIKFPNDANGLDDTYRPNFFDFDMMGIDSNHIYLGLASTRLAVARVNEWVSRCEDELMKLRLVAWMGKGFRLWNNHHPDYPANVLSQYLAWDEARNRIDTTRFLIRPVGRYKRIYQPDGEWNPAPLYESWDSTFIDFTLLKDVNTSINDLGYIGIQNRRTDPLVPWFLKKDWYYIYSPGTEVIIDSVYIPFYDIKFYSTSEFEDSCDIAKNPNSYQKFRDHWFSRAGC